MNEGHAVDLAELEQQRVRILCREAAETGNPLLFFQALARALAAAFFRAIDEAEAAGTSAEEAARKGFAADKTVRLPAELHRYLQSAVWRLCELEAGRDFREYPADHPHADANWGTPEKRAYLDELHAYRNRSKHSGEHLAPDAAAKLVAHAFGITRPGFNAFLLSEKRDWRAIAEQEEEDARARGVSRLQARLEAMERLGYQDERSFRRLKSGKPRGRGKPPG
jgi:hypothetical protein